jgi:protein arginine N-methyltransferase 1
MPQYSLAGFGEMLADVTRRTAYAEALRQTLCPNGKPNGNSVLEIGTGPGVFALLAARLGAREVVALETNEVIALGRQLATANRLAERVHFARIASTDFQPAQRADVVVSDLRGVLPLEGSHLATIIDARQRLLLPGGILIPTIDRLWMCLVTAQDAYQGMLDGFADRFDLDLSIARALLTHGMTRITLAPRQCLTEPVCWATLDYRQCQDEPVRGSARWQIEHGGIAHGIALWFDTELIPGVAFDTGPFSPTTLYRQVLLPLPEPLPVAAGDALHVQLDATRVGESYQWRWRTDLEGTDGTSRRFDQSTFEGIVIDPQRLARRASTFQPSRTQDAESIRFVLNRMDGQESLDKLAQALHKRFPDRFAPAAALVFVANLAERYSP